MKIQNKNVRGLYNAITNGDVELTAAYICDIYVDIFEESQYLTGDELETRTAVASNAGGEGLEAVNRELDKLFDFCDAYGIELVEPEKVTIEEPVVEEPITESVETGYYRISHTRNGVHQALLVKASSKEEAEKKFKAKKPDAEISRVSDVLPSEMDEFNRKGMPVLEDLDEALHGFNEVDEFFQKAKELGITTLGELAKFLKQESYKGETEIDTMRRYHDEVFGDEEPFALAETLTESDEADYFNDNGDYDDDISDLDKAFNLVDELDFEADDVDHIELVVSGEIGETPVEGTITLEPEDKPSTAVAQGAQANVIDTAMDDSFTPDDTDNIEIVEE